MPLIRQALLERESELTDIAAVLGMAAVGRGQLVVIEGAAGLGKTRLIEAALQRAREMGFRALAGRGSELERDFAFGLVRQLFDPHRKAMVDAEREGLFEGAAALARPLFTSAVPADSPVAADPTYATLHGLYWLLSNLSASTPVAIAVDDAHWADSPSLRFLAFVLPRLEELPVALIVALRTGDPGAERAPLIALTAASEAVVVRPRPLSEDAVGEMVAASLGSAAAEFAAACYDATAGNPFYLQALLRELSAQGVEPRADQAPLVQRLGPRTVSRAVLIRLSRLARHAPALARAAAVLGDGAQLVEAAEFARLSAQRAGSLADLLAQGAILKRSRPLEFVHPIVREAVYADLGEHERAAEHARAARLLWETGASSERIAAQLLGADPAHDAWAVDRLREAARRAAEKGAPEVAVRYLRRALAEPPVPALRPQVLLELGTLGAAIGEPDAMHRLREVLALAGEPEVGALAAFELGRGLLYLNQCAEAVHVIERTLGTLDHSHRDLRARLEVLLLMHAYTTTDVRRLALDHVHRIIRNVESSDRPAPELLAAAAMERAQTTGPAHEVARLAMRALADRRLLEGLSGESPALFLATGALTVAARGDLAEQHLDQAVREARRRGSARGFALASCFRAWTRVRLGNLPGAEADLRAFLDLAAAFSLDIVYAFGLGTLIGVLVERGEQNAAAAALEGLEPARCDPISSLYQELRAGSARLHLAQGRPQAALDEALAIARWEQEGGRHDAWRHWRPLAALAHAALGQHDQAIAVASDAVRRAREFGAADYLGVTLRAAGVVAERERSIVLLSEAVSVLSRSPARLEHARALVNLGAALRRANHRSDAREPLCQGLELARSCGAQPLAMQAQQELEATGARPRKLMITGLESLTASERRIVHMAAQGQSNPQIAQALFVSLKTVETHLGNAYRKLDIRSRFELSRVLGDET